MSPVVDANFMAEVEPLILTAGHDARRLVEPIVIDVSGEGESMTQMNGAAKAIRAGDMIMRDANGISCSILYGQDARSPISAQTSQALYVACAPAGIPAQSVESQLHAISANYFALVAARQLSWTPPVVSVPSSFSSASN